MKLFLIFQIFLAASLSPLFCLAQSESEAEERAIEKLQEAKSVGFDSKGYATQAYLDEESSLEHLKLLSELKHLESLWLNEFELSDERFQHITSVDWLKKFSVHDSNFTDAEVRQLAGMKQLETLDLSGIAITDASIEVFTKLPRLKSIDLQSTSVTPDGISKLRAACPDLEIVKHWKYYCGFQDGRAVLEIERIFIFFPEKGVKSNGGGGGGGHVRISKSKVENNFAKASGGGGLFNRISVSIKQEKDGPVFSIEDHTIKIREEGTKLIIDGEAFPIPKEFLSVTIDSNGVGKPQTHEQRPLPKREILFDDDE